jgi:hypothetical protein
MSGIIHFRHFPGSARRKHRKWFTRCEACLQARGQNFEHLFDLRNA